MPDRFDRRYKSVSNGKLALGATSVSGQTGSSVATFTVIDCDTVPAIP